MLPNNKNYTLFIADLHLKANDVTTKRIFFNFLQTDGVNADALYILGDLFVFWAGDDDRSWFNEEVKGALRHLSEKGVPIFCMPGNRDFLLGEDFAKESGCIMLEDPCVIDLYGKPTLLTHGDGLCSGDTLHKKISLFFRNKRYQQLFLRLPLALRKIVTRFVHLLSCLRGVFMSKKKVIDEVRKEAVAFSLCHHVDQVIHGHIHEGIVENLPMNNKTLRHVVLKNWEKQETFLLYQNDGKCWLT